MSDLQEEARIVCKVHRYWAELRTIGISFNAPTQEELDKYAEIAKKDHKHVREFIEKLKGMPPIEIVFDESEKLLASAVPPKKKRRWCRKGYNG